MKVHVMGVALSVTGRRKDKLTVIDALRHATSHQNHEFQYAGVERLLYIHEGPTNYLQGLLLTVKDQKRFCEIQRNDGNITINVREAEEGTSAVDFNFFVLNTTTWRGLYQYYRGSCWILGFGNLLAQEMASLAVIRGDRDITQRGGAQSLTSKQITEIRRAYKGKLETEILCRREEFDALIANLRKISGFQFSLGTITAEREPFATSLRSVARALKHQVCFDRTATMESRKAAVLNFLRRQTVESASVSGMGDDGIATTFALDKNPQWFGHYEFDEIAAEMTIQPDSFRTSRIMRRLLGMAQSEPLVNEPAE